MIKHGGAQLQHVRLGYRLIKRRPAALTTLKHDENHQPTRDLRRRAQTLAAEPGPHRDSFGKLLRKPKPGGSQKVAWNAGFAPPGGTLGVFREGELGCRVSSCSLCCARSLCLMVNAPDSNRNLPDTNAAFGSTSSGT